MKNTVEMKNVSMAFGANVVLNGVNLDITGGKVTALLGANGAGKSTLIKVLSGLYPDHGGQVFINGTEVDLRSPSDSKKQSIQTVHQRVSETIVPGLSVAENLLFERIAQGHIKPFASLQSLLPQAREIADGLDLGWTDKFLKRDVFELGIADQQLLTLARILAEEPKLLVLDEPTSALSAVEVEALMKVINQMREGGVGVLYVSHRLAELDQIADELVVLRDGVIRGEQSRPFDWNEALNQMLGQQVSLELSEKKELRGDRVLLSISQLKIFKRTESFDLEIRGGEVTGVIGLLGSGKTEIAESIFGATKLRPKMTLNSNVYAPRHPSDAISNGIYLVPEDRSASSMLPGWSIAKTVSLPFLKEVTNGLTIQNDLENSRSEQVIGDLGVVSQGVNQEVDSLSGGNQQKVIVGRWLKGEPKLLMLDEPFRGVDIGARRVISERTRKLAQSGAGVLVLTSEVDELLEVADRVIVLVDGVPKLDTYLSETSREQIVETMSEVA